ncbi:MAG: hypothetical protein MRERV_49c013 [Mycoplasmataceae bacterium RV_VA103A]|nr:MAG: hypothetical protein MRERV_49c013 [Mycoplasmataceae bacterium RV_VA103A]
MLRDLKTLAQLQAEINHLKQENAQLRLLFRVILDTAHLAVNGPEKEAGDETQENQEANHD